jgi:hypothetical protein
MKYNPWFEIAKRLFASRQALSEPIPAITDEDVVRLVRRDFPEGLFDSVISVLNEYGTERWEREQPRVRAAALKLASGNFDKLKQAMGTAKSDYRDVLAAAEYPEYSRVWGLGMTELSRKEKQRIFNEDWAQYELWLHR